MMEVLIGMRKVWKKALRRVSLRKEDVTSKGRERQG